MQNKFSLFFPSKNRKVSYNANAICYDKFILFASNQQSFLLQKVIEPDRLRNTYLQGILEEFFQNMKRDINRRKKNTQFSDIFLHAKRVTWVSSKLSRIYSRLIISREYILATDCICHRLLPFTVLPFYFVKVTPRHYLLDKDDRLCRITYIAIDIRLIQRKQSLT